MVKLSAERHTTFKIMLAAKLGWTWHRNVKSLTPIDAGDPKQPLVAIVENCIATRRAIPGARCHVCDSVGRANWYSANSPEVVSMVLEKNPLHEAAITDTRISAAIREACSPLMPKIIFYAGSENHI